MIPNTSPLHQQLHSPTLSDGSKAKRPNMHATVDEELELTEKFQKLRRLDSPTSPASPQYVNVNLNNRTSPRGDPSNRGPMSPKTIYPPAIQKYLTNKNQGSIDQAIGDLKHPSHQTFKSTLDQMKLLGMVQEQEIESNIIFRKANSISPQAMSPPHNYSPLASPMISYSPRQTSQTNAPGNPNYDDGTTMQSSPAPTTFEDGFGRNSGRNTQTTQPNMMRQYSPSHSFQNTTYNGYSQAPPHHMSQSQPMPHTQPYMGASSPHQRVQSPPPAHLGGQNYTNQAQQRPQFNASSQINTSQGIAFNQGTNQQGYYNNQYSGQRPSIRSKQPEYVRERTSSFLMEDDFQGFDYFSQRNVPPAGGADLSLLASNQLSTIQSIVQTSKKTISPGEPNHGFMGQFQKRNSNPDNNLQFPSSNMQMPPSNMPPQQMMQQSPPPMMNQNMNTGYNYNQNNPNTSQWSQYNNAPPQTQQQGQGQPYFDQMNGGYPTQNSFMPNSYVEQPQQFDPRELERKLYEAKTGGTGSGQNSMAQSQEMKRQQSGGDVKFSTSTSDHTNPDGNLYGFSNETNQDWNMQQIPEEKVYDHHHHNHQMLDPEAFFSLDKNASEDFDMNIIPTDVDFIPKSAQNPGESLEPTELIVPEPKGIDMFFTETGEFKMNS